MGTRFYASEGADGHAEAKRRIVAAEGGETARSIVFDLSRRTRWPEAYTGRVLRNRHAETWLGHESELEAQIEKVAAEYAEARERGDFDITAVIAGEACGLIHDIPPAGEIVNRIVAEAERLISSQAARAVLRGYSSGRGLATLRGGHFAAPCLHICAAADALRHLDRMPAKRFVEEPTIGLDQLDLIVTETASGLRHGSVLDVVEEIRDRLIDDPRRGKEPACAHPALALLVFLHGLE